MRPDWLTSGCHGWTRWFAGFRRLVSLSGTTGSSLVNRLLQLLLLGAVFIYLIVNAGMWWTSSRLIQDSIEIQAVKWIVELDSLGMPHYVALGGRHLKGIDERIRNFPEVAYVRYYDATGSRLYGEYGAPGPDGQPTLGKVERERIAEATERGESLYIDKSLFESAIMRVLAPVRVRSIRSDGLLNYSLEGAGSEKINIVGYIDLGMDAGYYRDAILRSILVGSLATALLLMAALFAGRRIIRRALTPLTDLQKPLAQLAAGDTDVQVSCGGDVEIAAIGNALNATIHAIKQRDAELRHLAEHDVLTGLDNRAAFMRALDLELAHVAEAGTESSVLFFDLDQFKYVNDTLGHAAGDRLLLLLADRLRSHVRKGDVVSRFGGDEFVVLARNTTRAAAMEIARKLNELMHDVSLIENGQVINVNCSIGVVMIADGRDTVEEVISRADMACYVAKRRGRNRFHMYEPGEDERLHMVTDIGWSQQLMRAIKENRFRLVYQPIVSLKGDNREYFEALLRLIGDDGKFILPDMFLSAAKRFGLMAGIDRWVAVSALAALKEFRHQGRDVVLSINLSGECFEDDTFLELIRGQMLHNSLPPGCVIFEVTEQTAVRYLEIANAGIQGLIALGCRFALDDFGKGFSSFCYLKHLPVDIIKIDGSFVENLVNDSVDQAMVRSIVGIACALGKRTVAEFVQDGETLVLLRELGVDYVQGYYLGLASERLPPERLPGKQLRAVS
jgi:diguanylate cyclase (GGDEF)-like protein